MGAAQHRQRTVIVRTSGEPSRTPGIRPYDATANSEVDLLAVYCGELDRCFLLPDRACSRASTQMQLRLTPAAQQTSAHALTLRMTSTFDGAIAQLGERRGGTAEVVGSSPTSSTPRIAR